ncbi:MAG: hypothetical protein ACOYM5_07525 [Caulobacter sp.]
MSPRIVSLTQTCPTAPSQWEGELSDGRTLYVRYRHGGLSIGIGATVDRAVDDSDNCRFEPGFAAPSDCDWKDVEPFVTALLESRADGR